MKDANLKKVGQFLIPLNLLDCATEEHAIRDIDVAHVNQLITSMSMSFLNGDTVKLPVALGQVDSQCTLEMIKEGQSTIQIIDGNHTLQAIRELASKFPEADCFKSR